MPDSFKRGDKVNLKTGTEPTMTIGFNDRPAPGPPKQCCIWFAEDHGEPRSAYFADAALRDASFPGSGEEPWAVQPGDVVQLKSGGPHMVVESASGASSNNEWNCAWFSRAGEPCTAKFPGEAFVKVPL